jgi:hypothetical protein
MLHKETVHQGTLELIRQLMADEKLKQFHLVGGTALALMLGHRVSIDIDLFTQTNFSGEEIAKHLADNYHAVFRNARDNYIAGYLGDVQFDMLLHAYPHVKPLQEVENVRMSSLEDIAAMKVNAIVGNGSRIKDFIDIHYLLKEMPYEKILESYSTKYPNVNLQQARISLEYFNDVDLTTNIILVKDVFKWKEVQQSIQRASRAYNQSLLLNEKSERIQKLKIRRGPRL